MEINSKMTQTVIKVPNLTNYNNISSPTQNKNLTSESYSVSKIVLATFVFVEKLSPDSFRYMNNFEHQN